MATGEHRGHDDQRRSHLPPCRLGPSSSRSHAGIAVGQQAPPPSAYRVRGLHWYRGSSRTILAGMSTLSHDLCRLIVRELHGCVREVEAFPDDTALWRVLPGVTNSAGNLALHLCGNLRHFVGTGLCATGYVRDRDAEFAAREGTRAAVVAELTSTIATMQATLGTLDDARLEAPMPGTPRGLVTSTRLFLLHLVAHTAFHLGQMGYLRRALAGDTATSTSPLPLDALETTAPR